MRQELCGLDSLDRVSYQATEFLALIVGNGGLQVLHLHKPFPNEHDLGDFGNSSHPRIANQLRIQRATRSALPGIGSKTFSTPEAQRVLSSLPTASMYATKSFCPATGRVNLICRFRRGWGTWTRSS
jgi:hypothetical protein